MSDESSNELAKSLRAEVTREQLYSLVQHLHEAIESLVETPDTIEEDMTENTDLTIEDANLTNPAPIGDPDKNPINWPIAKSNNLENDEDISKNYQSDNEEEDKWNNIEKACWTGYTQRGMKEKGGRMVPNCVPVKKVNKSIWNGTFTFSEFTK